MSMKRKPLQVSKQVVVPADTATFERVEGGLHFGQVQCPFCGAVTVAVGPGLVWALSGCDHSEGAVAGAGFDVTILFRGWNV